MVLIRGASVIDGTGAPARETDVLLKGSSIAAIGSFSKFKADTVIEGRGFVLSPGFIDVNTDSDHYLTLFTNPVQKDFLLQGVTTIVGGNCGASLAPLLTGSLVSIQKWADTREVNVDWHSVRELLETLERRELGVNFATLAGHATIRRALTRDVMRDLTENELKSFARILEESIAGGAIGFSTGLGYLHGYDAPYAEIKALASVAAEADGIYTTHLRDERGEVVRAAGEAVRIAEETKARTIISHFRPLLGFERQFESALLTIEKSDGDAHFDSYPFDTSIEPIYTLLPSWARGEGLAAMRENIRKPYLADRIYAALPELRGDDVTVALAPGAEYLVGRTLGAFAENRELDLRRGLLELMRVTGLRAVLLMRNVNLDWAVRSLTHARALVASNSPSFGEGANVTRHERMHNTFPRFLASVIGARLLSRERAIEKITSLPARLMRFKGRGVIREGYAADLVLMRDYAVSHVWVNGVCAVEDGRLVPGARAGNILKHS